MCERKCPKVSCRRGHRRRAINQAAGISRSLANLSIASRSSLAWTVPSQMSLCATRKTSKVDSSCGLGFRATSVFLGRQLRQQVWPVAGDDAAYFGIDLRDVVEALLNLLADHVELFRTERATVQEFH
jgi:hypothetical protein